MFKIIKKLFILLLPLEIAFAAYIIFDPFEVIYRYDKHYNDPHIIYNWDFNQSEVFLNNYNKYKYDSFIFGNSKSRSFLCKDWSNYVPSIKPFHFDASLESLYGIYIKLAFLKKSKIDIRNALIIIDRTVLDKVTNSDGHLYIKHPRLSNESIVDFHLTFIKSFFQPHFLWGYLNYKTTGHIASNFYDVLIPETDEIKFDPVTSDMYFISAEREILNHPDDYFAKKHLEFYARDPRPRWSEPCIERRQLEYLMAIKSLLSEGQASYKIIISPSYDQIYLNNNDLNVLKSIFGENNVYDYSGINKYTKDIRNYYESDHYRPIVAQQILSEIYKKAIN